MRIAPLRLGAGRVIGLAQRLDRGRPLAPCARGERVLEAADRRAEPAAGLRQSLGAEHDQRDHQDQEEMTGTEDVLDHALSLWFGFIARPYVRSLWTNADDRLPADPLG